MEQFQNFHGAYKQVYDTFCENFTEKYQNPQLPKKEYCEFLKSIDWEDACTPAYLFKAIEDCFGEAALIEFYSFVHLHGQVQKRRG